MEFTDLPGLCHILQNQLSRRSRSDQHDAGTSPLSPADVKPVVPDSGIHPVGKPDRSQENELKHGANQVIGDRHPADE